MKGLLLSVLASFVLAVHGLDCDPKCNACKDDHDIAKISCSGKPADCIIEKGTAYGEGELGYLLEPPIKEITADDCRKKCKKQNNNTENAETPLSEAKCEFFHWEQVHEKGQTDKVVTTCSLQQSCPGPSAYCETFDCVSGQLGCDEDCQISLPCSLPKTVWVHGNFHVICSDDVGDVDIYSPDIVGTDIADGTVCKTIRKCSEWDQAEPGADYFRQLAVVCDGSADPATWKAMEGTGNADLSAAMIDGNKINEQACGATCETITIPELQEWADLVCDQPLGENNELVDGNSCILLCDNHLRMTIDCKYVEAGDKEWQNADGEVLPENIKC